MKSIFFNLNKLRQQILAVPATGRQPCTNRESAVKAPGLWLPPSNLTLVVVSKFQVDLCILLFFNFVAF